MIPSSSRLNERHHRIAWIPLIAVLGLMIIGGTSIFSAVEHNSSVNSTRTIVMQVFAYGLGIVLIGVMCLVDYKVASRWAIVAYWLTIFALVLVPLIGVERGGAKRWILVGPIQVQPSELAKLAFIFAMANFLSRPLAELRRSDTFFRALGVMGLPFVLILIEPDLGSSLVFIPIGVVMMYVSGIPTRYIGRIAAVATVAIGLVVCEVLFAPPSWQVIKLHDYQKRRLMTYFGVDYAKYAETEAERKRLRIEQRNHSYNVDQALISVGSGGVWGKGWGKGTQYSLGYLPPGVAHNDFIFSVIAEEHGFAGSTLVVGLYSVVLISGIWIAGQARDRLGQLLAIGVVTLWFSQVFINIGMNIGLMPVTGLPLPLLSYGGSSVVSALIAVGVLQNVYFYRRAY